MAAVFDQPRPDRQQGVFETLLVVGGRPVELDAHLARLTASLANLFPDRQAPDLPTDVPEVKYPYGPLTSGTSAATRLGGDAPESMRITVAPNADGTLEAQISVREVERELVFHTQTVALHSLVLAGGLGAHKWADRSLLDEAQARLPEGSLPILVDADGAVLEASRANVFLVREGTLLTPPADGRILPGITRMRTMEIAAAAKLNAREAELSREDLLAADEVFLTSSVRGVERVRAFDGTELVLQGDIGSRIASGLRRTWTGAQVG